jgi:hypothetical protein
MRYLHIVKKEPKRTFPGDNSGSQALVILGIYINEKIAFGKAFLRTHPQSLFRQINVFSVHSRPGGQGRLWPTSNM